MEEEAHNPSKATLAGDLSQLDLLLPDRRHAAHVDSSCDLLLGKRTAEAITWPS